MNIRIASFGRIFIALLIVIGLSLVAISFFVKFESDEIRKSWVNLESYRTEKSQSLISMQQELGYGGMIHHYKNYLLRADDLYKIRAMESIASIREHVAVFDVASASDSEKVAIEQIVSVVDQYAENLDRISAMRTQGLSLSELDEQVKVDDQDAYLGLDTLNSSTSQRMEYDTALMKVALDKIEMATSRHFYIIVIVFFFLVAGNIYIIWFRVTKPLGQLSNVMESLIAGDFRAKVMGVAKNDEIGEVAHMLQLYKKKSIETFKAERQIKRSQRRYANILEIAPDAVISINSAHDVVIFNQGAEQTFEYEAAEVLGKNIHILIPDDISENQTWNKSSSELENLSSGQANLRPTLLGKKKDGSTFSGEVSISKFKEKGETFYTIFIRDVTERLVREAELKKAMFSAEFANRSKSDFLANMSHELRTPLNAIIGFSSILMQADAHSFDEEKYGEYSRDIHESGQHLLGLISDLLDLSKIEAGKAELHEQQILPLDLISSSINFVKVRAEEENLTIVVLEDKREIEIDVDARMFKQMMVNLLSNAVKFTPSAGQITVGFGVRDDGDYSVWVRDTGIGISQDHIDSVIQPFWQVDSKHERSHEGTGLGLPLVQSLIKLHGGSMDIQSKVGHGTTVELIFPAERVAKEIMLQSNVI